MPDIMLVRFVEHYAVLYGRGSLVYNVHALIHLPADVARFGALDMFSAFDFENYLHQVKRKVKMPRYVLKRIVHSLQAEEDLLPDAPPNRKQQLLTPREPWATPVLHDIKLVIKWISFKLA